MLPQRRSLKHEIIGGITTFLTMSYIIVVNPAILATEGTGMSFSGVMTATVLLAFSMTLMMGLYAKLPFAVAPAMGINAFVTYGLILGEKIPWPVAMGMVFWAGVLFLLISVTPLRMLVVKTLPNNIKLGATVGIGLFLAFIGLKNAGIIVANTATFVGMGPLSGPALLAFLGLLIVLPLMARKNPLAFLIGIVAVTLMGIGLGYTAAPQEFVAPPDFQSVFLKLDVSGALQLTLLPAILAIVFTDLFDSLSTFVGVARAGNLIDAEGNPLQLRQGLIVDSFATFLAGLFGTSSGTAFIESAAGIEAGARTGFASVVTAFCFLPFLFLSPVVAMVPAYATAPVLVCVGLLMFGNVVELEVKRFEEWGPAALTILLIPLTFSITKGFLCGILVHVLLHVLTGRGRELPVGLSILGVLSAILLFLGGH